MCCKLYEKDVLVKFEDVLLITKTNFIWIILFVCKYIKIWIFWCIMVKILSTNSLKFFQNATIEKYLVLTFVCDKNKFFLRPFYQNTNNNDKIIIKHDNNWETFRQQLKDVSLSHIYGTLISRWWCYCIQCIHIHIMFMNRNYHEIL